MAVDVKTLGSLAYASVKTKSGIAVASFKTINGIDVTADSGPPSTNLVLSCYHAGLSGYANNDPLPDWIDSSGTFGTGPSQATSGMRPLVITNQLNGHPIVRFDNSDDALTLASFSAQFTTAGTVYIGIKTSTANSGQGCWCYTGHDPSNNQADSLSGTTSYIALFQASGRQNAYDNPANNTWLVSTTKADANFVRYINSTAGASNAITFGFISSTMTLGYNSSNSFPGNCDMAFCLAYNVAHDATQRAAVWSWINSEYGI